MKGKTAKDPMKDFKARIKGVRTTRWVRFGIVSIIWLLFCLWMQNAWLLLVLPLLFDIYITHYIPFTFWKKSKNKTFRTVMSWVDAIVYALILVYFVFAFLGQNYTIPSSSLEKTLLTGDYLFVNKAVYGPRVPITPIHFPLAHNTWPIFGGNSYSTAITNGYHRLKGLREVEEGDIVVFNFPAGDTIMTNAQNPDYYQLVEMYGYNAVNSNPTFGEKVARPVDRRENYVKRVVGLPGQRFKIVDGQVYVDGKPQVNPKNLQFNYFIQTTGHEIPAEMWEELGVAEEDHARIDTRGIDPEVLRFNGFTSFKSNGQPAPIYHAPLTPEMADKLRASGKVAVIQKEPADRDPLKLYPFTTATEQGWTRADYGGEEGILIPKKGMTVELNRNNWLLYERPIRVYEGNSTAEWRNGRVYINGQPASTYTFGMDYYFMMGDNRDNSLDSRYWGFVPEDHIVGTPWRVLISFDKEKGLFDGKIRFNRIFKDANPDKPAFSAQ